MSLVMSQHPHAFVADNEALASPYSAYCTSYSALYNDEHERPPAALALSVPFASPHHHAAAPLPRRLSSTLLRLSPTFNNQEANYNYYQWNDQPAAAALSTAVPSHHAPCLLSPPPLPHTLPVKDELDAFELSPVDSMSTTPSISITSATSIASYSSHSSHSSPPSTPDPSVSTATATPTPSPLPPPAKSLCLRAPQSRQRSATMGSSGDRVGERVLRKRRRQRECDIQRRQKENMGFNRLYVLLTASSMKKQQKCVQLQQQQLAAAASVAAEQQEDCGDDDEEDTERKMNKADILHQSAERIEQLERTLRELMEAHSRRHSLESSMFLHSSACMMVIHIPSGYITDASERYLQHTCNERSWVVGRRFFPPWALMLDDPMYLTRPLPCTKRQADRVLCRPEHSALLQETQQSPQCEKSVRLLIQLCSGEIDTMYAVWRSQFGHGRVMEKMVHSWVSEWEDHDDGTRTPKYAIGLVSTSETICVDLSE